MVDALQALGIRVEASHHEVAVGQNEIDFGYGPALTTAEPTAATATKTEEFALAA